jgi:large subunit ribosomal protein L4
MIKAPLYTLSHEKVGECSLSPIIFDAPVRSDILARVVRWQLAKRQAGTHASKGISDVSGTTRKPYKQKGTGRARQGSLRSPQFRGGGIIFGPVPRSHAFSLPKRVRRLGLCVALSGKRIEEKLKFVESFEIASPKTKEFQKILPALGQKILFVSKGSVPKNFERAIGNVPQVDVLPVCGLNVYDILLHDMLVIEKEALGLLESRLAS